MVATMQSTHTTGGGPDYVGSPGYAGGPSLDWLKELGHHAHSAYEEVAAAEERRRFVVLGLFAFTAACIAVAAVMFAQRARAPDDAMEICNRHVVWNMPVEGGQGQVTAPSRQYLTEWNERCLRIEQLARSRALQGAAQREREDKALVDGVLSRAH